MQGFKRLPLVSVIISTYNRSGYLRLTVESVLMQTYPRIEIIIVDDGSTDDTPEVINELKKCLTPGDKRIISIRQNNMGGTAARNTGLSAANGEFINFLDHDDLFFPAKIEKQVKEILRKPKAGLVHCGYHRIDKDGNLIDVINYLPEGNVKKKIVCGCFLWSGAPLIRRECFDKVGQFDETVYSSDADMWVKIAMAGYHFACVQEPLGSYRVLMDGEMADVETTEKLDMKNMDDFFADKKLSPAIRKKQDEAYFIQRFWLSSRYYTIGKWEDAKRNLLEAIKFRPEILNDGSELYGLFLTNALDPRVKDPVQYIENVYTHLPENIYELVYDYKDSIISWVHTGIALHNYGLGNIELAKAELEKAISLNKDIINNHDDFRCALSDYAFRLPIDPFSYIDIVLHNLPENGKEIIRKRNLIISQVYLHSVYLSILTNHWGHIPVQALLAFFYNPRMVFPVIHKAFSFIKSKLYSLVQTSRELFNSNTNIKLNPGK